VPIHLRDTGGQASKRMGHGKDYLYSHEFPEAISGQEYLTSRSRSIPQDDRRRSRHRRASRALEETEG